MREDWYADVIRRTSREKAYASIVVSTDFSFEPEADALLAAYGIDQEAVLP